MNRYELQNKLHLSGMDEQAATLARKYGLGFELTTFCQAIALEDSAQHTAAAEAVKGIERLWFHAPFAELSPCAIDPCVREIAAQRFRRSIRAAQDLGIHSLVIHDGFIPFVYFPEWFVPQSIAFWREFLREVPQNMTIALENVMDPGPEMLVEIVQEIDDPRLGLCFDIGHANTCISKTKPLDWIEPMAPWLRHVHLHNNDGDWDLHAPLFNGTIPMMEALDLLLTLAPTATYTIENMDCTESLRSLYEKGYLKEEAT